jgi:signal transduction histidine kinase/ligand-binding sensor domain-containing protein/DNA-binding response OmpR family regulator
MRRILLLIVCLLGILSSEAKDDFRFRNLTMNDGLTANAVRNIVQDKNGYIWFGTDNGLCRYNGRRVVPFRISELGQNQYISALLPSINGLYVGTDKGVFFIDFERQSYERLPMDIHSTVTYLSLDKEGALWVSVMGQGVWQYVVKTGQIKYYNINEIGDAVAQVLVDNSNQIWAVTNWATPSVYRLNRLHNKFEPVDLSYPAMYNSLRMLQTKDGRMWLGTWEQGLLLMHSDGRLEQVLNPQLSKAGWHIHTLYEQADGDICIGCDDGMIMLNAKTREWSKLGDRFVYAITSDTEGGMWIGTFYSGVRYISPVGKRFDGFTMTDGLNGNVISRFCEDSQGRVWVGSDDGGLMCYSPKEQQFVGYPHQDVLSKCNVHALTIDNDNNLWIGTYTEGVMALNLATGRMRQYTQSSSANSLDNSSSYAIHLDKHGRIWVATMEGLNLYDKKQDAFIRIGKTYSIIIDIDEDKDGNLWLASQGEGLWLYDNKSRKLKNYRANDVSDGTALPDNQINCCMIDQSGKLWIGTFTGLCVYDKNHDSFQRVPIDVPSQNILSIIEENGALWMTTERGIVKYIPEEGVQRFTLHDGLVSEQFQPNSGLKTSDGRIYFGSTSGFNSFVPYLIKTNNVMPPVYVTSLEFLNREERNAEGLPIDLTLTKEITIGYSDSKMITLSFASLSYCSPEKIQYAYMLEGFDQDWNYVGNQNRATYTNLPAGTYIFRVKATNNDGIWSTNEAELRIVVEPPFWWSWYAKLLYLILICVAIYYYVHLRLKRAERQHQRELQQLNEQKEKEVREARLNFFTMIAHEIRTPVSLIIGPLEKVMKNGSPSDDLKVIARNAHRLLELVNQLLDFRKVEQQSMVMHFAPHNIYQLIVSISERFAPTFEQNGKKFTVVYPDEHFTAIVDKEALIKTISNLLTNANKYTKNEVQLLCSEDSDGKHFRIIVSDNGVGIREDDRQRIFQPFFQAEGNKPGTGIGLNIVKNIVSQHHGDICVESELGVGSTFTIVLPVSQAETEVIEPEKVLEPITFDDQSAAVQSPDITITHHPPLLNSPLGSAAWLAQEQTMLIVDDSEDMRDFLESNFGDKYAIITAGDGIEALHLLQKHEVNIIISDWMMPRMDGAEFCRRVRQNQLTSHIPFVMLTAKTDDDSKVKGMNVGADVYIDKPFSMQYLEACIRNMLQIRRHLMEKFSSQPLEPVTEIAQNPTDNEFLTKMKQIIEDNFSNSDLNVDFLAERLNISRSGLFAKIKTLADVTPNEMIQIVRLKRAAQLLHEGGHMVSEVGYMVGFSNPSYFSKCFQKQFGIRPADYMKNNPKAK